MATAKIITIMLRQNPKQLPQSDLKLALQEHDRTWLGSVDMYDIFVCVCVRNIVQAVEQ